MHESSIIAIAIEVLCIIGLPSLKEPALRSAGVPIPDSFTPTRKSFTIYGDTDEGASGIGVLRPVCSIQ